ncbi:unnamed protein product [Arabis nemorensis]|uniref:Uncharacterized protein n=1 Tax=Arabis nemorensis TaxID=586526 RepID=A0A565C9B1_9BRAS|nr:unnamed protein product [Arabis nemorensis]
MSNTNVTKIWKEVTQLLRSDGDSNVLRFYGCENDDHTVYLCMESWQWSLKDLVKGLWSLAEKALLEKVKVVDRLSPLVGFF